MPHPSRFPLKTLNTFLLIVGQVDARTEFCEAALSNLQQLIGFNSGTIYFFNENGKVVDWRLLHVNSRWNEAYLTYYHHISAIAGMDFNGLHEGVLVGEPVEWNTLPEHEFISDYIRARGLKHSVHFCLLDANRVVRTLFALDRTEDRPFAADEIELLQALVPHLNNLHRKFFLAYRTNEPRMGRKQALMQMAGLTKRETEIALRLCAGTSPIHISKALRIAPGTTHKHITHIYEKLHVSNLQELLVYLLGNQDNDQNQLHEIQ